jgi:hypothetical protein
MPSLPASGPALKLSVMRQYGVDDRKINESGAVGEWELTGETEIRGGNLPQCHFVHHKSHLTTWYRTRAAEVKSRRLTASAMARLVSHPINA